MRGARKARGRKWSRHRVNVSTCQQPEQPCSFAIWPSLTMSQSASASASRFESIFNSALDAYKMRTKQDLPSHPLLPRLQSCDSADAIIALLREQIPAFSQSQSSNDWSSQWLIPTVNVLCAFSTALGEGVGLVNINVSLLRDFGADARFSRYLLLQNLSLLASAFSFWSVPSMIPFLRLV